MIKQFGFDTPGQGLHDITAQVASVVRTACIKEGLCTVFVRNTSASLVIQENADVKAALTATSLSIPVMGGNLGLGTWQGIYLWEHRRRGSRRELVVHVGA